MRSISAVLRITREQLDARGQLGHYPILALISMLLLGGAGVAMLFVPEQAKSMLQKVAMIGAVCALVLGMGAWKVRIERRSNLAQERAIRAAAVEALTSILEHNPTLKPLIREYREVVKELIRKEKAAHLGVLLDAQEHAGTD
jgi:hypothetical protein